MLTKLSAAALVLALIVAAPKLISAASAHAQPAAVVATTSLASTPMTDIGSRHPNLRAAQQLTDQALARIDDAQKANEFDLSGHAAEAKRLLTQADADLKRAAMTANQNHM
jgi:hypothetical protein